MMLEAIKSVDIDLRREILANIVISGGTSNVSGFDSLVISEFGKLIDNDRETR
jgi:actin-related protein